MPLAEHVAEFGIRSKAELGRRHTADLGAYVADLWPLLGRGAQGLTVLGAAYKLGDKTQSIMEYFPKIVRNGVGAEVLLTSSHHSNHQSTQMIYVLKPGFWLCGVYVNYWENIATIVAISDNRMLSFYGLTLLAEKLYLKEGEVNGLENQLAERTMQLIRTIPRRLKIHAVEG